MKNIRLGIVTLFLLFILAISSVIASSASNNESDNTVSEVPLSIYNPDDKTDLEKPLNTQSSQDAIAQLMAATDGSVKVSLDNATGVPSFLRFEAGSLPFVHETRNEKSAIEQANTFFEAYGAVFGIRDMANELVLADVRTDQVGAFHVSYQQRYQDVPVFAGLLRVHFNANGDLTAVNGAFVPDIAVNATPSLKAEDAAWTARTFVDLQHKNDLFKTNFKINKTTLYVFRTNLVKGTPGTNHLVYEVEVGNGSNIREFVYLDAHTGKIVDQISGIHEIEREISETSLENVVWDEGNGDPNPIPPGWAGGTAQQVTDWQNEINGAVETYNIFASMTGGNYLSYDGVDAIMRTVNNDPGINCPNANWNGISTNYCTDVTGDDTVAHEWGHAYTEYTNNLIYQWQSGALNESYSDIWGETVDILNGRGNDTPDLVRTGGYCSSNPEGANFPGLPSEDSIRWLSGEDDPAFNGIPAGSGNAIRDLWHPQCFGDPGHVIDAANYHCDTTDSGGVHTNSGVPNHAFALMVDGGTYTNSTTSVTVNAIGLTKSAHIHWAAQNMLTPASDFVDHANALEQACSDLTGQPLFELSTTMTTTSVSAEVISAADCTEVANAIAAVEFYESPADQCGFTTMLDPNAPPLCGVPGEAPYPIFSEDWEDMTPDGWTIGTRDLANPDTFIVPDWDVVGNLPDDRAGSAAFVIDDPSHGACTPSDTVAGVLFLESPELMIPADATTPLLAFEHWVATEAGWDGGNVKISVNGGAWTLIDNSAITFNQYPQNLNTVGAGNDNPMAGEEAFTGTDGGQIGGSWGQTQADLSGFAGPGDMVRIRFEMGLDGCNGVIGWYVDNVDVYHCTATPDFYLDVSPSIVEICTPNDAIYNVEVVSVLTYTGDVTLSTIGEPGGSAVNFATNPVTAPNSTTMTIDTTGLISPAGMYPVDVIGMSPTRTHTSTVWLSVFTATPGLPNLVQPPDGAVDVPFTNPAFEWSGNGNDMHYLEIATDSSFTSVVYTATVEGGTSHGSSVQLDMETTYYWRVSAMNVCGDSDFSTVSSFTTSGPTFIEGTVFDGRAGWSLYAQVHVTGSDGTDETYYTNPHTGYYSLTAISGFTYTLDVMSAGYTSQTRDVMPPLAGSVEDFDLVASLNCDAPGYNPGTVTTVLTEDFTTGIPTATWTIVNNGGTCDWVDTDPGNRTNLTGGSGIFAIADSDFCGNGSTMDTELQTPLLDFSSFAGVGIEYKTDYNDYAFSEIDNPTVNIYDGANWVTLQSLGGADLPGPSTQFIDTTVGGGVSNMQVSWRYVSGWDYWWEVDDVRIYGLSECELSAGGLVVGNVYDANTGDSLDGATVWNDAGEMTISISTPDDPNVDDGFYMMFSPDGTQTFTATLAGYQDDITTTNVVMSDTNWLDFYLTSPIIEVTPDMLASYQFTDTVVTRTLMISNSGSSDLDWDIQEETATLQRLPASVVANIDTTGLRTNAPKSSNHVINSASQFAVLYDQTDNPGSNGFPSQYFPDFGGGAYGADDFVIPAEDGAWVIETVFAVGGYSGASAPGFGVDIYEDAGGLPGNLVYSAAPFAPTSDVGGQVTLDLPTPAALSSGTYWISVWADLAFNGADQWFWSSRTVQSGNPYAWEDRDGLFDSAECPTWQPGASVCGVGDLGEPDALFRLEGTVGAPCLLPGDIPWISSVSPVSGTNGPGTSTLVDVTFDSFGLTTGTYSGTLCINNNSLTNPLVQVPVQLNVIDQLPAIVLTKTVGFYEMGYEGDMCAETNSITVFEGTEVTYCYTVTNIGDETLDVHDLWDDQLGWMFAAWEYPLEPGESAYVTATTTITEDTHNTAVWTATIANVSVTDSDDAWVFASPQPEASLELTKTVGTDSGCADTDSIIVDSGTEVTYCYSVANTGDITLTNHYLDDDQLGILLSNEVVNLGPGGTYTFTTTETIDTDTVNTAVWTATNAGGTLGLGGTLGYLNVMVTDMDMATVTLTSTEPVTPSITLAKTVGTSADTCATADTITVAEGTVVYYCYEVTNTGNITLDLHTLIDDQLGEIFSGVDMDLAPGASTNNVDNSMVVSSTINVTTTNVATWTAEVSGTSTSAMASASATVNVIPASSEVYGVVVAAPTDAMSGNVGTSVIYTVWVTNTGNVADTFDMTITANSWTSTPSVSSVSLNAGESASVQVTVDIPATANNVETDTATVTATSQSDAAATDAVDLTTTAINTSGETFGVDLSGNDALSGNVGTSVTYTVKITNTGSTTDTFDLALSGNTWNATLSVASVTLAAGGMTEVSVAVAVPASANNGDADTVTVTATSQTDNTATDTTELTTTAIGPLKIYLPVVMKGYASS